MSDTTNTFSDESPEESQESGSKWRRELEGRARAAEEKAATLERQIAFTSVKGLDLSNPAHKFFADNYKGELDPAKVAEQATALGFIKDAEADTATGEVDQMNRFDNASNGATPADIAGSEEAKFNALLSGDFKNLAEFEKAAKEAGIAKNLANG